MPQRKQKWCGEIVRQARQPSEQEVEKFIQDFLTENYCESETVEEIDSCACDYGNNGKARVTITKVYEFPWHDIPGCEIEG